MTTRDNRKTRLFADKAAELALAVPQVVAHRLTRMALGGSSPTKRDQKEFKLMGEEKMAAFIESWNAMALQTWRINQQIVFSIFQSFWSPFLGFKKPTKSLLTHMNNALPSILAKGMAPLHRRAVANANRLNHIKLLR